MTTLKASFFFGVFENCKVSPELIPARPLVARRSREPGAGPVARPLDEFESLARETCLASWVS